MSDERSAPDLKSLEDRYAIRGELRGTDAARCYIGSTRDGGQEVAINIIQGGKGGENNALSHLAADEQILATADHPLLARVIEGRWVGPDAFAIVTERVPGDTLGQLLERGEHFANPQIALLLQQVMSALDWARDHGVVHRGITPDTMVFERGTNRLRLTFTPTPVPMTGVPDVCTDARTIATLAWTMMTGERYAEGDSPRSLGDLCPNLATRVIESTDKMLRCKDHVDTPDVAAYLAVLAAGDVMKQAEVELAALKEDYDEQHRLELQKCELHRQETEQRATEQLALLAGEREELERQISDERAAIAAERAQFEQLMEERKERLASVRAELDEQRVELERRLAELEAYRADVEKLRDDAIAAREEANAAAAKAATAFTTASAAATAAAATAAANASAAPRDGAVDGATATAAPNKDKEPREMPAAAAIPVMKNPYEKPVKLPKPPKTPKWQKMRPVGIDAVDDDTATAPNGRRPAWMIPAGVATLALIVIAIVFSVTHRTSPADRVRIGNSTVAPAAPGTPSGIVPRGGFLTQSAGGNVAASVRTSPLIDSAMTANAATTSASTADGTERVTGGDLMNPTPAPMSEPSTTRRSFSEPTPAPRRAPQPTASGSNINGGTNNTSGSASTTFTEPPVSAPVVTPAPVPAAPVPQTIPAPNANVQAAARAARARADSEAARRRLQAITDSLNSPASMWNKPKPIGPDTTGHRSRR